MAINNHHQQQFDQQLQRNHMNNGVAAGLYQNNRETLQNMMMTITITIIINIIATFNILAIV